MRLARLLLIALLPAALAGCLHEADRPRWFDQLPLLGRLFALDKPASLAVGTALARAEFAVPAPDGGEANFARDAASLGFEITVRDAGEGKVVIHLAPNARYQDPNRLLPIDGGIRGEATESFPGAAFDVTVAPTE